MKNLSQYKIEELRDRIGERVRSLKTNNTGKLIFVSNEKDRSDFTLDIDWDNGNQSRQVWHFWSDNVVFEYDFLKG